jgi:hypothetical protein
MLKALHKKIKKSHFKRFFKNKLKKTISDERLIGAVSDTLIRQCVSNDALKVKEESSNQSTSYESKFLYQEYPNNIQQKSVKDILIKSLFNDLTNNLVRNLDKKRIENKNKQNITIYDVEFNQVDEEQINITFSLPIGTLKEYNKDYINMFMMSQKGQKHKFKRKTFRKTIKNELVNKSPNTKPSSNEKKHHRKHRSKTKKVFKITQKRPLPDIFIETRLSSIPIDRNFSDIESESNLHKNFNEKKTICNFCRKENKLLILSVIASILNPILGMK